MAASTLTIRLDNALKEDAARIASRYGLDLSTVIRAFLTQIVNTRTIPLSFSYDGVEDASAGPELDFEEFIAGEARDAYDAREGAFGDARERSHGAIRNTIDEGTRGAIRQLSPERRFGAVRNTLDERYDANRGDDGRVMRGAHAR